MVRWLIMVGKRNDVVSIFIFHCDAYFLPYLEVDLYLFFFFRGRGGDLIPSERCIYLHALSCDMHSPFSLSRFPSHRHHHFQFVFCRSSPCFRVAYITRYLIPHRYYDISGVSFYPILFVLPPAKFHASMSTVTLASWQCWVRWSKCWLIVLAICLFS